MINPKSLDNVTIKIPTNYKPQRGVTTSYQDIICPDALRFIVLLHRIFNKQRKQLLENRMSLQDKIDSREYKFDFLEDMAAIRTNPVWQGPTLAPGLINRKTEMTGPPMRNMLVNVLNADVDTYMVDFEDSLAPTWVNLIEGQINLYDAIRNKIDFETENGKSYKLKDTFAKLPTIIARPRGWHMEEKHVIVDEEPMSASIFDFGIYFFHNAKKLIELGKGPYFYLPKIEHHLEAKLWNDIFNVAQDYLEIPRGTIRATVLIETLPAAFQMEEIIYQLRQHSSGLNCGRWDYLFSTIKRLRNLPEYILPNRDLLTMTAPFMDAYVNLLIKTCHKRGVHAMGGMAAQIPIKNDVKANTIAMDKIYKDKNRELTKGHDGSWIAHPALAHICNEVFSQMGTPNQIFNVPKTQVTSKDLLDVKIKGSKITLEGVKQNLNIGLIYIESWLNGSGCLPINNLMEDAATAEVSRCQLYQWVKYRVKLADTQEHLTPKLVIKLMNEQVEKLSKQRDSNSFSIAAKVILPEVTGKHLSEFLTTLLYDELITRTPTREIKASKLSSKF